MNLIDILEEDLIKVPLASITKEEVLEELVDVLAKAKGFSQTERASVLDAVINREALGSTGIGKGICIPHAQSESIDNISVVVGVSRVPIDFDSPDNLKSRLFFLVVASTDAASAHVEVLASIARTCSSGVFRRMLEQCKSSKEVLQLFSE
ncbi:MAG: PTS sugar transporter subunit IIA [Sphaerochaetaceae bacterium]|jgi:mannitol/fructose-specific phosphotransferase system IIA component (Ntr-type)|nr:PTS sugar transporter subunit IIA [Sphaerochaetaceae bacterium]MDC7236909.1 PTS sugar transporter subunit IIA [Sphaerochaetaceae bacterium]MDC7249468.1 PTS sugar transporter subunit IIA [Sphaerochaetaceae bacterium]